MIGRKPIYEPEKLEIGQKLTLRRGKEKFGHQYATNFNNRFKGRKFKFIDGFIERVS